MSVLRLTLAGFVRKTSLNCAAEAPPCRGHSAVSSYDLVIKNGTVIDGTQVPRYFGDLAIKDGVIVEIGGNISTDEAAQVIDAKGLIVAPGVIDPHTHYDAQINWDPYCTSSGWHGNTSFVVGNCGFGFMPCRPADRERYMAMMENTEQVPVAAMREALPWTWESFPEWMEHMKRLPKGVNIAAYLPLNSLLIYVMGYEAAKSRGATREERLQMRALLNEAMDAGAIGFGFSYLNDKNSHKDTDGSPMPTDSMNVDDAYHLAEVLRERDEGVIQILCELSTGVRNRHVAEELARISGRPVLHNVVSVSDARPSHHTSVMAWLDECQAKGLNIYSQTLAFRVWSEFNAIDQNSWQQAAPFFFEFTYAGNAAAKVALAGDPAFRARAREQYKPELMAGGGSAIETWRMIRAPGAAAWTQYEGLKISEISEAAGMPAVDCFFEIVAASDGKADFRSTVSASNNPSYVADLLKHPRIIPGTSDGGAHIKFFSGGHYATDNIMWLVKESGLMTLEQLHFKLSFLPARIVGFEKRGALLEGYAADIYIYDYAELGYDNSAYGIVRDVPGDDWRRVVRPIGIRYCIVNGSVTLENSEPTGALTGRMLDIRKRRPGAKIASKTASKTAVAA
jgi:N-acyl-D-amino-acid deacylase